MNKALFTYLFRRTLWLNVIFAIGLLIWNLTDLFMFSSELRLLNQLAVFSAYSFLLVWQIKGSRKANTYFFYNGGFSRDAVFTHLLLTVIGSYLLILLPTAIVTLTPIRAWVLTQTNYLAPIVNFSWMDLGELLAGSALCFFPTINLFSLLWMRGMNQQQPIRHAFTSLLCIAMTLLILDMFTETWMAKIPTSIALGLLSLLPAYFLMHFHRHIEVNHG